MRHTIKPSVLLAILFAISACGTEPGTAPASANHARSLVTKAPATAGRYLCQPRPPIFVSGQVGDSTYCATVANPAFAYGQGPKVLFDEGHHNFGKISGDALSPAAGRYHALGEVLKADGYQLDLNLGILTPEVLAPYKLLVIVAPLSDEYFVLSNGKAVPTVGAYSGNQAFTAAEVSAIRNWVQAGGSLLFNTEHSPFLPAVKDLFAAFGLSVEKDAYDIISTPPIVAAPNHPIFRGRSSREQVSAFPQLPDVGGGVHLISTSDSAVALARFGLGLFYTETLPAGYANQRFHAFCKGTAEESSASCQALLAEWQAGFKSRVSFGGDAMKAQTFGQGRIAVFTEFSTLTSQFQEKADAPYGGLTSPEYTQLLLNTLHWLSKISSD